MLPLKPPGKIIAGKDAQYQAAGGNFGQDSNLQFFTALNGTDTERLRIDSNGLAIFTGDVSASGDLFIEGSITTTAITSSKITSSIIVTSGSNIFGDEISDTQTFFGHITASGNISASGEIFGEKLTITENIPRVLLVDTSTPNTEVQFDGSSGNLRIDVDNSNQQADSTFGVRIDTAGTNQLSLNTDGELTLTGGITASGNISSSGAIITEQIYVGSNIFHNGDTNTNITFGTDTITFKAGNEAFITITEDGSQDNIVIGDGGDIDFHVKAGGDNTLFAQGSSQRIGIGTATPTSKLQVSGDITTTHITASGNISASGDILTSGDFLNSQTIQMTNSSSVINTFNTGSHQTCKYVLQVTSGSFIQSSEMLVVQSGSNAFNTEYAQIGTAVNLGSFSTSVSGNVVKLSFAGDFISCSVKFNRTLI